MALPPLEEQDPADLAAIEAALGQADAAQAERLAEDGSDAATATVPPEAADAQADAAPVPAGETSADTVQAPPRDTDAGRVAEIRSNGIVAPQDQSGVIAAPSPPAPFGADPLPPLRGSPEALALQSAAPESAAPESATPETAPVADITPAQPEVVATPAPPVTLAPPATPVLPAGEDALTIGVTEGVPPSVPPAKPARLTQPETPAPETLAPETLAPEAPAAPPGQGASVPPPPVTEADLVIQVTQGTPAVVPPRRAESNVAPATVPAAAPVPVAPVPVEPAPGQQGSLLPITPAEGVVSPDTPPASTDLAAATVAPPPPGGVALSALRPAARPSDLRRVAEPVVPEEPAFPNATEEAVETSVRPNGRPAQFAEVVQRALRVATQRQATPPPATEATEAVQTASAAVAMPALPTSTSVAREATVARAINLRQVNLLGVMGTSSNRRALVRLSNGRIVTVRVGENLDDGQVTAIGDTELRYVRRGRDVVLRIAS